MSNKLPYPEYAARQYPPGKVPENRKIISCSESNLWYAGFIGKTITVYYFASFGAWDIQGRWLWYYDLSGPVKSTESSDTTAPEKTSWFKKLFK
jgi:hypothetical protein